MRFTKHLVRFAFINVLLVNLQNVLCQDINLITSIKNDANLTKPAKSGQIVTSDEKISNVSKCKYDETIVKDYEILQSPIWDVYWLVSFYNELREKNIVSFECERDVKVFLTSLNRKDLWALMMFDSWAKIPFGLLSGNVNQFGDFDECLNIKDPIKGKYFLTALEVSFVELGLSEEVDSLIHSHRWITSNLTDPGHRVPRGSSIYWGICLPASCSSEDVQSASGKMLGKHKIKILVENRLSYVREDAIKQRNTNQEIIIFFIFGSILLFNVVGTVIGPSHKKSDNFIGKFWNCFSLIDNVRKITNPSRNEEVLGIDGARVLNAFALLLFHKSIAISFLPFINRTSMAEILSMPWAILGRTAIIYTDSFLLISGFLSTNAMIKDLDKKGKVFLLDKVVSRIFRFLPNLLVIVMFCTYILPRLGNGPLWGLVVNEHSNICKKNMWRNFLFVHNFFGFENMCLTHTHQLGIDMQLFMITPFIVTLLWKFPKKGRWFVILLGFLSTCLRYLTTISKEYSTVLYYGMPVRKIFDTANYSYILPSHRLTIYLMGTGLAYFMYSQKRRTNLTKFQICFGWLGFISLGLVTMLGPWRMGQMGYVYNSTDSAIFNAFSPITWGLFISWGIWATHNQYAGWFGNFLSWSGFKIFSKLSYSIYLVQFPMFFYKVGVTRFPGYYSPFMMFELWEFFVIAMASFTLTATVEIPLENVYKTLIKGMIASDTQRINLLSKYTKSVQQKSTSSLSKFSNEMTNLSDIFDKMH